jgi:hypothetical protein
VRELIAAAAHKIAPLPYPNIAIRRSTCLEPADFRVAYAVAGSRDTFVERLCAERRRGVQAYLSRRIRTKYDAAALAQEVYVRMLRASDADAIRNSHFHLYAIASNLVKGVRCAIDYEY